MKKNIALLTITSILLSTPAMAAGLSAIPSLHVEETWDSNIFNTSQNPVSDYIFRVIPGLGLSYDVFSAKIRLSGSLEMDRYASHKELDSVNLANNVNLTVDNPLVLSPRFSVTPVFSFIESKDSTRRNYYLAQTPTPGLPVSQTTVTTITQERDYAAGLNLNYLVAPTTTVTVGGGATKVDFPNATPSSGLANYMTYFGNASVLYGYSPKASVGPAVRVTFTDFQNDTDSTIVDLGLKGSYSITPPVTLSGGAGVSRMEERQSFPVPQTNTEWFPIGYFDAKYTKPDFTLSFSAFYGLVGGTSAGAASLRTYSSLGITSVISPAWSWNLFGSYEYNRPADNVAAVGTVATGYAILGVNYQAWKWASVYLTGYLTHQWARGGIGQDISRESVVLGIKLSDTFPLF